MNEPVVNVTVNQILQVVGQKEVELILTRERLGTALAKIAELEKEVENLKPKE